jgi:hypothetical protein
MSSTRQFVADQLTGEVWDSHYDQDDDDDVVFGLWRRIDL